MKVCTCFLLFGIFAHTNSISRIRPKGDHRAVHLPKEGKRVREYSNEGYSGDTDNVDNVHSTIIRDSTVLDKNMKLVFRAARIGTLTDFIQEAVKIVNTYEDTAFEDFFHVLDKEIRKYHYRGCKFSELTQNSDTRSLLAGSLKSIRGKSVSFIKANLNEVADMMRDERYDQNVKDMLDYINSLYKNTELTFHNVLNELKYYRNTKSVRTHNNLIQVIRSGVRAVLFNPYTELNTHTRKELRERIETFWKKFKNNPASSAEINDIPYTDPVIKPVINSFKVSENIMNEVKNLEPYSKNDPQAKSKNQKERTISIETYSDQRDETEKDESINESEKQTSYNTDEISSGQSFYSSSNSIKNSQERHEEYNKQQYMTLYTEEISYKAKTTKKTEIIPISENVMTRRPKVKKRLTTTSTSRERNGSSDRIENIEMLRPNYDTDDTKLDISNSSRDTESESDVSKLIPRARENYDKQQKHGKADESRSKSKQKNVEIISQYNAVIDVQLANTEMLRSLGMFEPLAMDTKFDPSLQTEPVPTKSTILPRFMRPQAEIKPQKSTARDFRKHIAPPLPNEGNPVDQLITDKNRNQKYFRRSDNVTIGTEDFNTYVIKRINDMENELNELKQMNDINLRSKINDSNNYEVQARNVTDKFEAKDEVDSKRKYMKGNGIERLLDEGHDLNNEENHYGHEFTTRNNTVNTESSTFNTKSRKQTVINKNAVNATDTDKKNTTQVSNNISKINVDVTKKLNKEVINNNVTTSIISLVKVTNATKVESVVTSPTVGITKRTMVYSEPSYYDSKLENHQSVRDNQFDPFFDHVNDGIDLRM